MTGSINGDITNRLVVAAVTRDHTEIWAVLDNDPKPIITVKRPGEREFTHIGKSQEHHMHRSDRNDDAYYKHLSKILSPASEIMLVGHGKGDSNIMEAFAEYFRDHHPLEFKKVSELRYANLPALTGAEIVKLAHHWKNQQKTTG